MDRTNRTTIVHGVISRHTPSQPIIEFYGEERSFGSKTTHKPTMRSFGSETTHAHTMKSFVPPKPVVVRELDITSSITGPKLSPFGDFFLPSNSDIAAVIFFPMNHDKAFSFAEESFRKRMYFMSREMNVYGRRILNLKQVIEIISEIMGMHQVVHLELGGHGDGRSIQFPECNITVGMDEDLLSMLFSMLVPKSTVHLVTCRGGLSIIDYLARIGKGHRFIGTSCDMGNHLDLKVDRAYPLQVTYTKLSGENVTVIRQY